jgi:ACR3 family arsenite transporter
VAESSGLDSDKGQVWFERQFLPLFRPVTIVALLVTLVLIFTFQAQNIVRNWTAVILLAIPIIIQVYFNSSLAYGLMRLFKVRHNVATPGALIGASNFFELQSRNVSTLLRPLFLPKNRSMLSMPSITAIPRR